MMSVVFMVAIPRRLSLGDADFSDFVEAGIDVVECFVGFDWRDLDISAHEALFDLAEKLLRVFDFDGSVDLASSNVDELCFYHGGFRFSSASDFCLLIC